MFRKLEIRFPQKYDKDELKERLFFGLRQQLRDTTRFLYLQKGTTYEILLQVARNSETEYTENKVPVRAKATVIEEQKDSEKAGLNEFEDLKRNVEVLT